MDTPSIIISVPISQLYVARNESLLRPVDDDAVESMETFSSIAGPLVARPLTSSEKQLPAYEGKQFALVDGHHRLKLLFNNIVTRPGKLLQDDDQVKLQERERMYNEYAINILVRKDLGSDPIL